MNQPSTFRHRARRAAAVLALAAATATATATASPNATANATSVAEQATRAEPFGPMPAALASPGIERTAAVCAAPGASPFAAADDATEALRGRRVSLPSVAALEAAQAHREARIWQRIEADLRAGRAPQADVLLVETGDGPALLLVRNDLVDNLRLLRARDLPLASVYD